MLHLINIVTDVVCGLGVVACALGIFYWLRPR